MKKFITILLLAFIASKTLRIVTQDGNPETALSADDATKGKANLFSKSANIKNAINDLCDGYDRITKSFNIQKSREIKQIIERDGFSKLHIKSNLFIMTNLIMDKYDSYVERRAKAMRLKDDVLENFLITAQFGAFADDGFWNKADIVYEDGDTQNSYDSLTVFAAPGSKPDAMDILISQFQVLDFKVADDLIWVKKNDNYFNFFKSEGEEFVKRPKTFTEAQVTALIEFYKLLSFKFLADTFGIQVKLPNWN